MFSQYLSKFLDLLAFANEHGFLNPATSEKPINSFYQEMGGKNLLY